MTHDRRDDAPRVGYQGIAGAFGEAAVQQHWDGRASAIGAPSFAATLDRLVRGALEWAVIPIWNSSIGVIVPGQRALEEHDGAVEIVDHVHVPVRHCLLGRQDARLPDIRFVGSHPAALAQCRRFFATHERLIACEASNTGSAARELAAAGDDASRNLTPWYRDLGAVQPSHLAVIASARAARYHGLSIVLEDVQDDPGNATRFAVVAARSRRRW